MTEVDWFGWHFARVILIEEILTHLTSVTVYADSPDVTSDK